MNYSATQQKLIVKETEDDILALVAVNASDNSYEVVFEDGTYRDRTAGIQRDDFFRVWRQVFLPLVHDDERARLAKITHKKSLLAAIRQRPYVTYARFAMEGGHRWCRLKFVNDVPEPGVFALSIRNVHDEVARLFEHKAEIDKLAGILESTQAKVELLSRHTERRVQINTFGAFTVSVEGAAVPLRGRAKEILALLVANGGRELGNKHIYRTIWEGRAVTNRCMTVYFNALARLRRTLADAGVGALLVALPHGQMLDTSLYCCDLYDWLDGMSTPSADYAGQFLEEYSWAEHYKPLIEARTLAH